MKKPELLSPAGSFEAAYQAFEAGADGVYLGLTEFSARKSATNFDLPQLRRILGLARQKGRRIYVTVNTVIREAEMPRVASLCGGLQSLDVDGVIVQDVGLCALLARGFPHLAIHASTQMAIHNDSGLRFAREVGIRRVVLSRELTLEKIRSLRQRHADIELEVFVHGALCYSFSGVCLASWALTGRSGNRGDCAQICRSVFCSGKDREATPFSCRDLSLGTEVLKLAEAGIDSLKIEGRMKSPEYVFHVTRLYREILDKGSALSEAELGELQRRAETTFSREKTKGYFSSSRGEHLLTTGYPGHRGIPLGTATRVQGREIGLRLVTRVSLRDGVGYWLPGVRDPVIFSVRQIRKGEKQARFAEKGDAVFIPVEAAAPLPPAGSEVRLFSSRFLDRPVAKESTIPPYRIPVKLEATLREESGAAFLDCRADMAGGRFAFRRELKLIESTGGKSFEDVLSKLLGESGSSLFTLGELSFSNMTGRADREIFVPPSELKKARKEIFAALEQWHLSEVERTSQAALAAAPPAPAPAAALHTLPAALDVSVLGNRDLLSPPARQPTPFATLGDIRTGPASLSSLGGLVFVPLPPVMPDDDAWIEALRGLFDANPKVRFAIGLSNVGHLDLARTLADQERCSFFVDFYLYVANRSALSFLAARIPRLLFLYSWIEAGETILFDGAATVPPVVRIAESYRPPLFYSLGCYERHAVGGGLCRDGCPKDFTGELRQGRNTFTVAVNDCVTYLFQASSSGPSSR